MVNKIRIMLVILKRGDSSKETKINPIFNFWSLTLEIELSFLVFVRSSKDRTFVLCIQALQKIAPLIFAPDHLN